MVKTILGEQILSLRKQGKTYKEIVTELNCCKATVSYYCGEDQKNKEIKRSKQRFQKFTNEERAVYKKLQGYLYDYGHKFNKRSENRPKLTKEFFKQVFDKISKNPKCYLTGENINLKEMSSWSFDHKIPLSKGGSKQIDNLGLCLRIANQSKTSMTPEEFVCFCKKVLINYGYQIIKK